MQVTFFSAIMSIDKRRQDARRFDVALCCKSKAPRDAGILCGACEGRPKEKLSTKLMRYLGTLLSKRPAQVVVVLLWLGALAAGIVGTSQMKVKADVNDFIPEGSYLKVRYRFLLFGEIKQHFHCWHAAERRQVPVYGAVNLLCNADVGISVGQASSCRQQHQK